MNEINVIYGDLEQSKTDLTNIIDKIEAVKTELGNISSSLEELGAKHDDCFADTSGYLDELIASFGNYITVVEFMQAQCANTVSAFEGAEADNIELSEAMKEAIGTVASIAGIDMVVDDLEEKDIKFYKEHAEYEAIPDSDKITEKDYAVVANAQLAEGTWNSVIDAKDKDKTNADETKKAETTNDDDKSPTGTTTGTTTGSGTSAGGGSYAGGGAAAATGGAAVQYRDYTPKEEKKEEVKEEDSDKIIEIDKETKAEEALEAEEVTSDGEETLELTSETSASNNISSGTAVPQTEVITTPSPTAQSTDVIVSEPEPQAIEQTQTTEHTGGGYNSSGYAYYGEDVNIPNDNLDDQMDSNLYPVNDSLEPTSNTSSIDNIIPGRKTKIPTSSPIAASTKSSGSGNSVIPIVAGLSAAAAAGVGAKAYMDRNKNDENGEADEFATDEWDGDESVDSYNDSNNSEEYLDEDDDYSYQAIETEKYGARNNEELADLQ